MKIVSFEAFFENSKHWSSDYVTHQSDCSRGGYQSLEMLDCGQWKAMYVGLLAVRMTTTVDSDD